MKPAKIHRKLPKIKRTVDQVWNHESVRSIGVYIFSAHLCPSLCVVSLKLESYLFRERWAPLIYSVLCFRQIPVEHKICASRNDHLKLWRHILHCSGKFRYCIVTSCKCIAVSPISRKYISSDDHNHQRWRLKSRCSASTKQELQACRNAQTFDRLPEEFRRS